MEAFAGNEINMQLDSTILTEFVRITGKDLFGYFRQSAAFFAGDYNTIVNYYSGNTGSISSEPFANFKALQEENGKVFEVFKEHSRQFNNVKWWLLIEQIEEIDNRLKTLANINKWSRSSLTKVAYDPTFQVDYTMRQKQTLENVSALEGSGNPNDDWADLAIRNDLQEEEYTPEGGVPLKLNFSRINRNYTVTCVVDIINGKSIYGKDVDKRLQWTKTNGYLNLKTLSYDETIKQAILILIKLKKGDNPEFPTHGLQTALVVGTNRSLFNFPVIIRQKSQDFANDDTLKNFTISNLNRDQDNMSLDYQVQTRIDEVISDTISL